MIDKLGRDATHHVPFNPKIFHVDVAAVTRLWVATKILPRSMPLQVNSAQTHRAGTVVFCGWVVKTKRFANRLTVWPRTPAC